MEKNEIPDKVPGMHLMPITMEKLQEALDVVSTAVIGDIRSRQKDIEDVGVDILRLVKDRFGDDWPPAAIHISAQLLGFLLEKFATQIIVDNTNKT